MANIDQVQLPDGSQYHIIDDTSGYATTTYVQDQISTINKNTIGLGNVDNTADINKPVSLPQQAALNEKVDDDIVAYVESDTTATKRYEVGDQFILNGVLYTATAIIAVNDTIVVGTNCEASDTLVEQNDALSARIDTKTDQSMIATVQPNLTAVKAYAKDEQFVYNGLLYKATAAINSGGTITIGGNCTLADSVTEQIRAKSVIQSATRSTTTSAYGYFGWIASPGIRVISAHATEKFLVLAKWSDGWYVARLNSTGTAFVGNETFDVTYDYY